MTLNGVNISGPDSESCKWAGINCEGNATLILKGTNNVKGFYEDLPGIFIAKGKTLTIKGDGSLTAKSNGYAAGIGGAYQRDCGNIIIEGGTITANGGTYAAGIGGGYKAACGNITITNGVTSVTATKGSGAPHSIGNGEGGSCGTVTIGGNVGPISQSPYTYKP